MSDNIPLEIQIEIFKKLSVKSVIQCRSVSKKWKTLIDSSNFIVDYTKCSNGEREQHLLVRYQNLSYEDVYLSFVDDLSFPGNKFSPTVPTSLRNLRYSEVIGISHGLVCIWGHASRGEMAVVWIPFIRKSVAIDIPNAHRKTDRSLLGFGVCPKTCDPKIIRIDYTSTVTGSSNWHWQVEVYTLSSGVWRNSIGNLPRESVGFVRVFPRVDVLDGTIYWKGISRSIDTQVNILISFNLSSEEFREIPLPDKLASSDPTELNLCNGCDSIGVMKGCTRSDTYEIWMMEKNPDSKWFTNLLTLKIENADLSLYLPLHVMRNGEFVMIIEDDTDESIADDTNESAESAALVVYEPVSKHLHDLGIKRLHDFAADYPFCVGKYTESLILLDK